MLQFRLRTLLLAFAVIALMLGLATYWDAIPGTYHKDVHGFPKGTGMAEYYYDDGSLMIREWYFRGLIYRSTWFRPDGTEITTETYGKASGGIGYYLRQDGTIKSKYTYEYDPEYNLYVDAGSPVYYDRNGNPAPGAMGPIE